MFFLIAALTVLLLHLGFILFALLGAFLVARWRWLILFHLPAVAWAIFIEVTGRSCPLTTAENFFRIKAGQAGYPESFIEHYLLALIYPAGLTPTVQWGLAAVVMVVNVVFYGGLLWKKRRQSQCGSASGP